MVQTMSNKFEHVLHGQCKLAAASPADQCRDCLAKVAELARDFMRSEADRREWLCEKCRSVWPESKLADGLGVVFCPDCKAATCGPRDGILLREQTRQLKFLQREAESYIKDPGCNINSRRTKFERLRWAVEQSKEMP